MAGDPPPDSPVASSSPLTIEDFRSLRRWLAAVTAVAVVATGVAIFALLSAGDSAGDDDVAALEERVAEAEKRLGATGEESDIRGVERRLRRSGEEADVRVLDRRIARVEEDVVDLADATADTGRGLERLSDRVESLAREVRRLRER